MPAGSGAESVRRATSSSENRRCRLETTRRRIGLAKDGTGRRCGQWLGRAVGGNLCRDGQSQFMRGSRQRQRLMMGLGDCSFSFFRHPRRELERQGARPASVPVSLWLRRRHLGDFHRSQFYFVPRHEVRPVNVRRPPETASGHRNEQPQGDRNLLFCGTLSHSCSWIGCLTRTAAA